MVADGNFPTTTPGKAKDQGKEQMQRLAKLAKKHRNGHITKVRIEDWPPNTNLFIFFVTILFRLIG